MKYTIYALIVLIKNTINSNVIPKENIEITKVINAVTENL